jgi:hypothetical protein
MITRADVEKTARRLLELQPAADEYRRLEHLVRGQLLHLDIDNVEVPGLGRVGWNERGFWDVSAAPVIAVIEVHRLGSPVR